MLEYVRAGMKNDMQSQVSSDLVLNWTLPETTLFGEDLGKNSLKPIGY